MVNQSSLYYSHDLEVGDFESNDDISTLWMAKEHVVDSLSREFYAAYGNSHTLPGIDF